MLDLLLALGGVALGIGGLVLGLALGIGGAVISDVEAKRDIRELTP